MAGVLLDSSVLIDLLRGANDAGRRLGGLRVAGDIPYICAVNVEEVARGIRSARERIDAERLVRGLWLVPVGESEGWRAGSWRQEFGARGITLAQSDCLVAAAAASIGGRLATGNPKHFPMTELQVEHWPAGA
jgi:predicted nucleic acid-binding protein